jgi:hypothetical protein
VSVGAVDYGNGVFGKEGKVHIIPTILHVSPVFFASLQHEEFTLITLTLPPSTVERRLLHRFILLLTSF